MQKRISLPAAVRYCVRCAVAVLFGGWRPVRSPVRGVVSHFPAGKQGVGVSYKSAVAARIWLYKRSVG